MTARTLVVHRPDTSKHSPLDGADTIGLTPGQVADLRVQLGLPDDNQSAAEVAVSPTVLGGATVQAVLEAIALAIAADNSITSVSYTSGTGTLTINDADNNVFTAVITDLVPAAAAAPAVTVDPAIPNSYYGTGNTVRLGTPDGWFSINGKRVPYFN